MHRHDRACSSTRDRSHASEIPSRKPGFYFGRRGSSSCPCSTNVTLSLKHELRKRPPLPHFPFGGNRPTAPRDGATSVPRLILPSGPIPSLIKRARIETENGENKFSPGKGDWRTLSLEIGRPVKPRVYRPLSPLHGEEESEGRLQDRIFLKKQSI